MAVEYLDSSPEQQGFLLYATRPEKEEFLIFSLFVAGKDSAIIAEKTKHFLNLARGETPFETVTTMIVEEKLVDCLKEAGVGKYGLFEKALPELIKLDPEGCTVDELVQIPGVGKKTSRFYKLYTDPDFVGFPIDTHILKFLRGAGYDVPKSTPSGKKYKELEETLSKIYEQSSFDSIQKFDYFIWKYYFDKSKNRSPDETLMTGLLTTAKRIKSGFG